MNRNRIAMDKHVRLGVTGWTPYDQVYFARSVKSRLIKVGITSHLEQRLIELARLEKGQMELLAAIPSSSRETEDWFLDHFQGYCVRGEWFDLEWDNVRDGIAKYLTVHESLKELTP